jgi:hypothetical protein
MHAIAVIDLFVALKRLNKRVRYKPMHQKRPAPNISRAAIAQPNFDVWLGASSVFFWRQTHNAFRHPSLAAAFSFAKTSQRLNLAKRAHLVSAFVPLDVGPHFNTSIVALRLLHGYPLRFFLR